MQASADEGKLRTCCWQNYPKRRAKVSSLKEGYRKKPWIPGRKRDGRSQNMS